MPQPTTIFSQISRLLVLASGCLVLPAWVCHSDSAKSVLNVPPAKPEKLSRVMPASDGVQDAASGQAVLQEKQPAWILVGNSMLKSRVHPELLAATSEQNVHRLSISATKSAMWFLMLKQMVAGSRVKPDCVSIFFKNRDLTWPEQRVHNNDAMIERLQGRLEPEWHTVLGDYDAHGRQHFTEMADYLAEKVQRWMPSEPWREWARGKVQKTAFRLTQAGHTAERKTRLTELNDRLSLNHQRPSAARSQMLDPLMEAKRARLEKLERVEPLAFDPSPAASFLPHMIAVAKEAGLRLHFHRIQVNPSMPATGSDSERLLPRYLSDLQSYLESQGCIYTDETGLEKLHADLYVDDVHLKEVPEVQKHYAQAFWQSVRTKMEPVLMKRVSQR
jgi:hypothetical protein